MSPLQKIAMGMVVVIGSALVPADPTPSWQRYDALADPIGWVLVLVGVFALSRRDPAFAPSRWWAGLAAAVSVPAWFPQVQHQLDTSGQWFASLPQLVFCLLLAREIAMAAPGQRPPDRFVATRFGLLVWGFALVTVLPVITLGGDIPQLANTTVLLSTLVNVAFVYQLFRVHRREWLGGPGPLVVPPRTQRRTQRWATREEGRPPSV